jgi:hypothetical protein
MPRTNSSLNTAAVMADASLIATIVRLLARYADCRPARRIAPGGQGIGLGLRLSNRRRGRKAHGERAEGASPCGEGFCHILLPECRGCTERVRLMRP